MKTAKVYASLLPILLACGFLGVSIMPPFKGFSRAERLLEEIRHGLHPEFAKILFVMESYRDSDFKVVLDGTQYQIRSAFGRAQSYLRRNYHGEVAEAWIKNHLYRSSQRGEVIYLKFPDGNQRPLRDVLLEDLRRLPL